MLHILQKIWRYTSVNQNLTNQTKVIHQTTNNQCLNYHCANEETLQSWCTMLKRALHFSVLLWVRSSALIMTDVPILDWNEILPANSSKGGKSLHYLFQKNKWFRKVDCVMVNLCIPSWFEIPYTQRPWNEMFSTNLYLGCEQPNISCYWTSVFKQLES